MSKQMNLTGEMAEPLPVAAAPAAAAKPAAPAAATSAPAAQAAPAQAKPAEAAKPAADAKPAATPKDVITKLNHAALQATKAPEFQKRMHDLGYNIIPGSPQDMAEMIQEELKRWGPIVKASGAKVD